MITEVLDLIISIQVEILTAMEIGVIWVGILNAILIKIGPGSVDYSLEILAVLSPSNL